MKNIKTTLIILLSVILSISAIAQTVKINKNPKSSVKLKLLNQENGTNGSSVAYNTDKKIYYAVIAGNSSYPLETFDINGKQLNSKQAGGDMRGMWYNSSTKSIEFNGYDDGGYNSISLNSSGFPEENITNIVSGKNQPSENSCGVYEPINKEVIFYSEGSIYFFNSKNGKEKRIVHLQDIPTDLENINSNSLIYTGSSKNEIGLLNFNTKEVYLFDANNGNYSGKITLPENAVTHSMFWFAYANGNIFLYNSETRTWTGYKIL